MKTNQPTQRIPTGRVEPDAKPSAKGPDARRPTHQGISDPSLWGTAKATTQSKNVTQQAGLAMQSPGAEVIGQLPEAMQHNAGAIASKLNTDDTTQRETAVKEFGNFVEEILSKNPGADVNEIVQWVLLKAQDDTNKDLHFHATKVQFYNDAKKMMREHISQLREYKQLVEEWEIENNRATGDAWFETETTTKQVGSSTNVKEEVVASVAIPPPPSDPLIIDLDGDGQIETTKDVQGDGFLIDEETTQEVSSSTNQFQVNTGTTIDTIQQTTTTTETFEHETRFTEWVGPDDGLLVMDRNEDGIIQREDLFGDESVTGRDAANGYEDLALLDENGNGIINAEDPAYKELRVWQDKDSDGVVDPGEMLTLDQAGVAELRTTYENNDDSTIQQVGTFKSTRAVELEKLMDEYPPEVRAQSDMDLSKFADGQPSFAVTGEALTSGEMVDAEIQNWEGKLQTAGDDAQLANLDLQNMLQKQQRTLQTMSNVMKSLHDTAMSVVRKIGG